MKSFGTGFDLDPVDENEDRNFHLEDLSSVWDYRTRALELCNALVNTLDEVEERLILRDELRDDGLSEVISVKLPPPSLSLSLRRIVIPFCLCFLTLGVFFVSWLSTSHSA